MWDEKTNLSPRIFEQCSSQFFLLAIQTFALLYVSWRCLHWCAILIAHQIVTAKHRGSCVYFSGISTCGRTSRETVSHPQCPPLPTLCKISLPIYVIVTNKLLQPLTTTWYDSLVLSISLLKIYRRLIKLRSFLCVLRPVLRGWWGRF